MENKAQKTLKELEETAKNRFETVAAELQETLAERGFELKSIETNKWNASCFIAATCGGEEVRITRYDGKEGFTVSAHSVFKPNSETAKFYTNMGKLTGELSGRLFGLAAELAECAAETTDGIAKYYN